MKTLVLTLCSASCLLLGYALAQGHAVPSLPEEGVSISRTGAFELDRTPENALPLFTAPGEKLWISIWDPTILKGNGFEKGTLFVTNNHGHTTYWMVLEYDTTTHRASYSRVTPGADMGKVTVSLKPNGRGGSHVHVRYELTGLSEKGNQHLKSAFSEENYRKMMVKWRTMIIDSKDTIDQHMGEMTRGMNVHH